MNNIAVIRRIEKYLYSNKSVDIKWFIADKEHGLGCEKNDREIDIIVQALLDKPWFTQYQGHNRENDISIKYNYLTCLSFYGGLVGGIIGIVGGALGIISFIANL